MTDHSNPITDILTAFEKYMSLERNYTKPAAMDKAETLQALYEAVAAKVLACGRMDIPEVGNVIELDEVLTNLSLLFGVAMADSSKASDSVEPKDTKSLTIAAAKKRLAKELGDSEGYHSVFDDLLEEKLAELDPKFMKALNKLYDDSGESRWYA